jgi:ribosome maturation factor RimP
MNLKESFKMIIEGCGVQLYDTVITKEHNHNIFRVYITSPDGITLEKCTEISRMISPLLDINEPINGKYNLEVSSPGIERKLKTLEHFMGSIGSSVKIKEYSTKRLKGELIEVSENGIIKIKDNIGNIYSTILNNILSASTYFEWEK